MSLQHTRYLGFLPLSHSAGGKPTHAQLSTPLPTMRRSACNATHTRTTTSLLHCATPPLPRHIATVRPLRRCRASLPLPLRFMQVVKTNVDWPLCGAGQRIQPAFITRGVPTRPAFYGPLRGMLTRFAIPNHNNVEHINNTGYPLSLRSTTNTNIASRRKDLESDFVHPSYDIQSISKLPKWLPLYY